MYAVIINTAVYQLVGANRGELMSFSTDHIPGFATKQLADQAAQSLQFNIANCERQAWVAQLS